MESEIALTAGIWRPLGALILASAVIMGSPGPSTISVTTLRKPTQLSYVLLVWLPHLCSLGLSCLEVSFESDHLFPVAFST